MKFEGHERHWKLKAISKYDFCAFIVYMNEMLRVHKYIPKGTSWA